MAVDSTRVLHLRFDLVFSVFLVFMVAVIVSSFRQLGRLLGRNWREYLRAHGQCFAPRPCREPMQ
jgi:hypothetical protein